MNSGWCVIYWGKQRSQHFVFSSRTGEWMYKKKSHTCEQGRAHLRIPAWHLLMNLKHNYLLKNHTHVKKAGCTSEFMFGIYWWTWKNYSLKNCWSGPMKNVTILIFTMLYFFKKTKKTTWNYRYFTPVYLKSWWYDLQFLRYSVTDWNW